MDQKRPKWPIGGKGQSLTRPTCSAALYSAALHSALLCSTTLHSTACRSAWGLVREGESGDVLTISHASIWHRFNPYCINTPAQSHPTDAVVYQASSTALAFKLPLLPNPRDLCQFVYPALFSFHSAWFPWIDVKIWKTMGKRKETEQSHKEEKTKEKKLTNCCGSFCSISSCSSSEKCQMRCPLFSHGLPDSISHCVSRLVCLLVGLSPVYFFGIFGVLRAVLSSPLLPNHMRLIPLCIQDSPLPLPSTLLLLPNTVNLCRLSALFFLIFPFYWSRGPSSFGNALMRGVSLETKGLEILVPVQMPPK